jgi:competence protein ComEA
LNINTATAEQLTTLPMIGVKRAAEIVQFRTVNGPFTTVEDLANVPGIGDGTIKMLRDLVRTG